MEQHRLVVIIPAFNEAGMITDAVRSVQQACVQVIVVADNCTDDTAELARKAGATVLVTVNNTDRKAGALNQALTQILPGHNGEVMVMDADSTVGPAFISTARERLHDDPTLGAVGGVFYGRTQGRHWTISSWLEQAQANEYGRYSRVIAQRRGRVSVLTGTATMFRREALQQLLDERGFVYDSRALTEDSEITLALKTAGWKLISPAQCTVETELMPTLRTLRVQRMRWYRGALDNLLSYGWTPVTRRYWGQQAGLVLSTLAMGAYLGVTAWGFALGALRFSPFWTGIGFCFVIERLVTVWRVGWRARLLAVVLVPETLYDVFLQVCFISAIWTVVRHKDLRWEHLSPRGEV